MNSKPFRLPAALIEPPHECSVLPFWFWNDALRADEIVHQIADMEEHGVHGFVIHPRVGLPRDLGWMSGKLLLVDLATGQTCACSRDQSLVFSGYELKLVVVASLPRECAFLFEPRAA